MLHGIYEWSLVEMILNNRFYVTAVPLAITSYNRFTLGKLIYSMKGVRGQVRIQARVGYKKLGIPLRGLHSGGALGYGFLAKSSVLRIVK